MAALHSHGLRLFVSNPVAMLEVEVMAQYSKQLSSPV